MAAGGGGMGRVLGLGFLVGAKDQGATRVVRGVSEGFDQMKGAVEGVSQRTNSLQRFGNAIGALNLLQLSKVGDALGGIAERAGAIERAGDTSLESFGVQARHAFRVATAGMGDLRSEVQKYQGQISSAAFNLEVDAGEITQAVAGFTRTGSDLEDYGLTVRDVAGSIQAGVLNGDQLVQTLTGLAKSYDLGEKGAVGLLDKMTALGEKFGVGADAARALPDVIKAADPILSEFTNLNIEDVTDSITRLGLASQRRLGGTFQEGVQDAIDVFQQLSGQRQALSGMITGLQSDFPDLAKEIGIASGDIDKSIDTVLSDPLQFAKNVRQLYSQMDPASVQAQRLRSSLSELPAGFRYLIEGGEESAEALQAAGVQTEKTEGAFKKMAKTSSGVVRTFGESMDLVQDRFTTNLNKMLSSVGRHARKSKGVLGEYAGFERQVIQRQRNAYRSLSDMVEGFASKRGPLTSLDGALGSLTRTMLAARRGGITGLTIGIEKELGEAFPGLSKKIGKTLPIVGELADGFLTAALEAGPLLLALTQMHNLIPGLGSVSRLLFNPLTMIAGAMTAVYFAAKHWDAIGPMVEGVGEKIRDFSSYFLEAIKSVNWKALGDSIVDGIKVAFGATSAALGAEETNAAAVAIGEALRNTFQAVSHAAKGLATGVWESIVEWITAPDTAEGRIKRGAASAGVALGSLLFTPLRGPIVKQGISAISGALKGISGWLRSGVGAVVKGGSRAVLTKIPIIGGIVGALFELPNAIDRFLKGDVVGGLSRVLYGIVDGLLLGIPSMLGNVLDVDIGGTFEKIVGEFASVGSQVWNTMAKAYDQVVAPMFVAFGMAWNEISAIIGDVWRGVIKPIFNAMGLVFSSVFEGIVMPVAKKAWDFIAGGAGRLWNEYLVPGIKFFADAFLKYTHFARGVAIKAFTAIGEFAINRFFDMMSTVATLRTNWKTSMDVMIARLKAVGESIKSFFMEPILEAGDKMFSMMDTIDVAVQNLKLQFLELGKSVIGSLQQGIQKLVPVLGDEIAGALDGAMTSMDKSIKKQKGVIDTMKEVHEKDRQERQQSIAEIRKKEEESWEAFEDRRKARQKAMTEAASGVEEQRRKALGGMQRVEENLLDAEERFSGVLNRLMSGEMVQHARTERERDKMETAMRKAEPMVNQIRSAAEAGVVPGDSAANLIQSITDAAAKGSTSVVENLSDKAREMISSAEGDRGGVRARVTGDTTEKAHGRSRVAHARMQQERARDTGRELQNEMQIAAFGNEALRQLSRVFHSGGGRGNGRKARGAAAEGGAGDQV